MLNLEENNSLTNDEWKIKIEKEIKSLYLDIEVLKCYIENLKNNTKNIYKKEGKAINCFVL